LASGATVAEEVETLDPDFTVRALVDDDVVLDIPPWERLEGTIPTAAVGDGTEEVPEGPDLKAVDVVLRVL